jgi:ATP-dependent Lon protease
VRHVTFIQNKDVLLMPIKPSSIKMPFLPLRDVVIFPHMVIPLFVGRTTSIHALEQAMDDDKQIFLVGQRDSEVDDPQRKDLYDVGSVATVLQMLRLPDGTVKALIEGSSRAHLKKISKKSDRLEAVIEIEDEVHLELVSSEQKALMRGVVVQFEKLVEVNKKIPPELVSSFSKIDHPGRLVDSIAAHLTIRVETRQQILETTDLVARLELMQQVLNDELDIVEVEKKLQGRIKDQVEKSQRQYYLSEKIKAIQQELVDTEDGGAPIDEIQQFEDQVESSGMTKEAQEKVKAEISKLKMMPPMSAEATVSRNYLEAMFNVPWKKKSKISKDLEKAEAGLEADHYGLKKVKERILEYLAVQQRVKKLKGPILCLVGPPGVGKTSLGESIANATGRQFARISLGGVRDEAEIRGHRRTYIGAMPGKIIQKMSKVKVRNPLFMLDEVDKMAADFRGDPASALLEVLDPQQNNTFNDHYLEVDYDLSDVMFIATSNSLNIPPALLDRMEVIRLAGYTEDEKLNIAKTYLVPRQYKENGLRENEIKITDGALREIIRSYTREAGVRNLERDVANVCRKVVRQVVTEETTDKKKSKTTPKVKNKAVSKKKCHIITKRNIEKYLGVKKFRYGLAEEEDQVGQVTGLAWTEVGGELLVIEAQTVPGKGKSLYTGRLGDVMQESIHAAMTVVRSRAEMLGVDGDYFQKQDFHVHVPEGATPKDGPSAGIGMCTAIVSSITKIPVKADVAMTGEITLRGEVLPIGGLKEKLLAALRGGIKTVIISQENVKDLQDIPDKVKSGLTIIPVKWVDEVLTHALTSLPESYIPRLRGKPLPVKSKAVKNHPEAH